MLQCSMNVSPRAAEADTGAGAPGALDEAQVDPDARRAPEAAAEGAAGAPLPDVAAEVAVAEGAGAAWALAGADAAGAPVDAAAEASGKKPKKVEELYVTGSRIRRLDLATSAPVTVVDREELDASGLVSIGDILQNLPVQSNAINVQFNNGGDGSTRVSLRGLGAQRTSGAVEVRQTQTPA